LHGEGGIGLISSRLTIEGPVKKEKSSFVISGRRTYIDLLAAPILARNQKAQKNQTRPGYYFYDVNAKLNISLSSKDKLYVSGYFGRDQLYINEKSESYKTNAGLDWGNATGTLRWNHLFSQKLFANSSLILSHFDFGVMNDFSDLNKEGAVVSESSLRYNSRIKDLNFKTDFDFYPSARHALKFGAQAILHRFVPSALMVSGTDNDNINPHSAQPLNSLEASAYVEDTWQPSDILKMNLGIRMSMFKAKTKTYFRPEPRISAALKLARDLSWKFSYAQMNQYIHLLSNTGVGLPTDLWVPATDRILPQRSEQFAAGFAKDLNNARLLVTLEGYYKKMSHIIAYKEDASFLNINGNNSNEVTWEDNITSGRGSSYGGELLIQKKTGTLSGWIGYTVSWTRWKFPELNSGKTFFPRHDRRHDISLVAMYDLNKRITISANWVYGTGNALTLPVSKYTGVREYFMGEASGNGDHLLGSEVSEYSGRGNFRAEAYHRMDVAAQFRKVKKRYERTWEIGGHCQLHRSRGC
jgi:hypothetical protein